MKPIRRGDTINAGPFRVVVTANWDGRCEIHTIYDGVHFGRSYVAEEVLVKLREND